MQVNKLNVVRVHACCEATGAWEALALFLNDHGQPISVVNPAQIAADARVNLSRTKDRPGRCAADRPVLRPRSAGLVDAAAGR